jgi:hypothetical protein
MTNWDNETEVPWYDVKNDITKVIVDENVTSFGNYAFYGLSNVEKFVLSSTQSNFAESVQLSTSLQKIQKERFTLSQLQVKQGCAKD